MEPSNLQKIIIVDFGSQFTQLVARKIRELGSYSEKINFKNIFKLKNDSSVNGLILSGGPLSITDNKGISLDLVEDLKNQYEWAFHMNTIIQITFWKLFLLLIKLTFHS